MLVDTDTQKVIIAVVASYVLLAVFICCAIAFVLMLFGVMKPDKATKKFLYSVFSVSTLGILVLMIKSSFHLDTEAAATTAERQASVDIVQNSPVAANEERRITIFTQIGDGSEFERRKFNALKATLAGSQFLLPAAENVSRRISQNEIRFCNIDNKQDADRLKDLLKSNGFLEPKVTKIERCDAEKNKNILEVWLKSGR